MISPDIPVVAISGPIAAGKEEAANILKIRLGFTSITISDLIREQLAKTGIEPPYNREHTKKMAQKLHMKYGKTVLAKMALAKVTTQAGQLGAKGGVIEGWRYLAEGEFFKENSVAVLWLNAPRELRYQRILARAKDLDSDLLEKENFINRDYEEMLWMYHIPDLADKQINNTGSLTDLEQEVVSFVSTRFRLPTLEKNQ
jgi:dephospho-CoA kinase